MNHYDISKLIHKNKGEKENSFFNRIPTDDYIMNDEL